jgi:hypothetical protein
VHVLARFEQPGCFDVCRESETILLVWRRWRRAAVFRSSLWSTLNNGEYADEIVSETDAVLNLKYYGQRSGIRDHLVSVGSYVLTKSSRTSRYVYVGRVIAMETLPRHENINVFSLTISKEPREEFRRKNDACERFGWERLNQFQVMHGIISH